MKKDKIKFIHKVEGTSLVFMVMMVGMLIITGSVLMIMIITYYKINIAYAASEQLYYKVEQTSQIVFEELEKQIKDILEKVKIYDETNTEINDGLANLIANNYSNIVKNEANVPYSGDQIKDYLMKAIRDSTRGTMTASALYDVAFKLAVRHESTGILGSPQNELNTLMPDEPPVFRKEYVNVNRPIPQKELEWVRDVCRAYDTTPPSNNIPPDYYSSNYVLPGTYYSLTYEIKAWDDKAGISKTLSTTFQVSSEAFENVNIYTQLAKSVENFNNDLLKDTDSNNGIQSYALITGKDLIISGNGGTVNINGGVYAFGKLPDTNDITKIVVPEDKYNGIIINGSGKTVAVNNGYLLTRGYLKFDASNITFSFNNNKSNNFLDVVCDTLLVSKNCNNSNITIYGDLSTFDDIRVNGSNTIVNLERVTSNSGGNYYGLNEGDVRYVNRSSAIILNNITSIINIRGNAWIGGYAFVGNITYPNATNPNYAFRLAESSAIGENYKIYGYRLNDPVPNDSDPPATNYNNNVRPEDFREWSIKDIQTNNVSSAKLLCKMNDKGTPDLNDDEVLSGTNVESIMKKHVYYYAINSVINPIAYNYQIVRNGLNINLQIDPSTRMSPSYTKGILHANGRSYWGLYTPPWGTGSPDSRSGFERVEFRTWNEYRSTIDDGIEENRLDGDRKDRAVTLLKSMKNYLESSIGNSGYDVNTVSTREDEFVDKNGILFSPSQVTITGTSGNYFWYLTNREQDITITNNSSSPIRLSDINNRRGIIFTRGSITLNPTSDLTFNGTIIALKGITINTGRNVIINYDDTIKDDIMRNLFNDFSDSNKAQIRKFFAPGNVCQEMSTWDIYRESEKNVRIVDKRVIRN